MEIQGNAFNSLNCLNNDNSTKFLSQYQKSLQRNFLPFSLENKEKENIMFTSSFSINYPHFLLNHKPMKNINYLRFRKHELAKTTTQKNYSEEKGFKKSINDQFNEKMGRLQALAQNVIEKSRNYQIKEKLTHLQTKTEDALALAQDAIEKYQIKEKLTHLQTKTEDVLSTAAEAVVGRFLPEKEAKEMVRTVAAQIPRNVVIKFAKVAGDGLIDCVSEGIPDIETMITVGTLGYQIINWKEGQNTDTFKNAGKTVARKAFKSATNSLIPFPFNAIIREAAYK